MTQTALPPLNAAWDPRLETLDAEEFCWTSLQLAARSSDIDRMRRILAANPAAVHAPPCGYYGQTALQAACVQGDAAAVRLLLGAGANVHAGGGHNMQRNALQLACGQGDEAVVDVLLAAGARVDELADGGGRVAVTRYNGRTAVQAACERGHVRLARRLLRLGADVNAPPSSTAGLTAVQAAARGGYLELVAELLKEGADANAPAAKYKGFTALQGACRGGHIEVAALLLRHDVDVHALGGLYGDGTALHAAAEAGRADIIEMLLAAGADVNARSTRRGRAQSPLQSAVAAGHEEAARALRENGATGKSGGGCFLFP